MIGLPIIWRLRTLAFAALALTVFGAIAFTYTFGGVVSDVSLSDDIITKHQNIVEPPHMLHLLYLF